MKLRRIRLNGYKSIGGDAGQAIPLGDVTVLLGANGSGKSNLVSFFRMLNSMTIGALRQYVGKQGVNRLLFYGAKRTESISFELHFEDEEARDIYAVKLSPGLPDRLFVSEEKITCQRNGETQPHIYDLNDGGDESCLKNDARAASRTVYSLLSGIRIYHFHDTSDTARIKGRGYADDARYLRSDAGNLAAFLRMLKGHDQYKKFYDHIVRRIQCVMPQFGDFDLEPIPGDQNHIRLNWTDSSANEYLFDPDQISDGSLRFIALAALLLQPRELLPKFIVLDEPELGLHPAAVAELAGFIRAASQKTQVLVATQSMRLVDEFSPENLIIVERDGAKEGSSFKKPDPGPLGEWLKRYSLSELWEKNVLGGQP
jgi:predicted ATPase